MSTNDVVGVGSELAGHRLESVIGQGGMGIVYRATHLRLEREVALKVISPALAEDQSFRHRFQRESRTAASLRHPHIVTIFDAGEDGRHLYITMEYVHGTDLKDVLAERGPLDPKKAIAFLTQISSALDAAHNSGLVHRDVKPANMLIEDQGDSPHAYLTDFGLTRHVTSVGGVTKTGQWVGTLDYVAPEQVQGEHVDGRADTYSLSCVLYEALTGEVPFPKDTDMAKMWAQVYDDPPSPAERADIGKELDAVVRRGLSKDPEARFASSGELTAAAAAAVAGKTTSGPARRRRPKTEPGTSTPRKPAGPTRLSDREKEKETRSGTGEESTVSGAPSRGGRLGLLMAAAGAIALVGGFFVAGGFSSDSATSLTTAKVGGVQLSYSSAWIRDVTGGAPLEGFRVRNAIALGYEPLSGAGILRAGKLRDPAPGVDPLPKALKKRLGGKVDMQTVQVGGVDALSYSGETTGRPGKADRVNALIIPTAAGYQGVACQGAVNRTGFFSQCDEVMASVRLVGTNALTIGADPKLAGLLGSTYETLRKAESMNEDDLSADSAKTQARAAHAIANSYKAPLRDLRGYDPAPRDATQISALITAMKELRSAYDDLATAAGDNDSGAYDDARDAVGSGSRKFDSAVHALEGSGYPVRVQKSSGKG